MVGSDSSTEASITRACSPPLNSAIRWASGRYAIPSRCRTSVRRGSYIQPRMSIQRFCASAYAWIAFSSPVARRASRTRSISGDRVELGVAEQVADGVGGVEHLLWQEADRGARTTDDPAGGWRFQTDEKAEKR